MQNRQLKILKAAMPYTALRFRKPMQIVIQAQELSDFISTENENDRDIEACDLDEVGNIEGMIENIRQYCTSDEISLADNILGFMRTRNMLRSYMGFMEAGKGNSMADFLMSQLTPEQRSTYEKMMSI